MVCPAGKWSGSLASSACTNCLPGTWSSATGAVTITTCKLCLDSEYFFQNWMTPFFPFVLFLCVCNMPYETSWPISFWMSGRTNTRVNTRNLFSLNWHVKILIGASASPSAIHPGLGTLNSLGNYALGGSDNMDDCMNTMSMCPNVPLGAEMLLDQYLNCGTSCARSCTANTQMLTGTCIDATGTGTVCKACTGSCRMDLTVTITL